MQAMIDGNSKALLCLGGNFAVGLPDPEVRVPAMGKLAPSVHIGTKPNRSHLLEAKYKESGTPSYKSVPVRVLRSEAA